jgi:hypothetical protein
VRFKEFDPSAGEQGIYLGVGDLGAPPRQGIHWGWTQVCNAFTLTFDSNVDTLVATCFFDPTPLKIPNVSAAIAAKTTPTTPIASSADWNVLSIFVLNNNPDYTATVDLVDVELSNAGGNERSV